MMEEASTPKLMVHIVKGGRPFCKMEGAPISWPENHLYISYQDVENAKEANCPGCVAARDVGPHLSDRLNDLHVVIMPYVEGGTLKWVCGTLPPGVVRDASGLDVLEESTGQAAHFDVDLGWWSKVG